VLGYVLLAAIYAVALVPLCIVLARTLAALSALPRSREIYEGLAASSILAVCAALALTRGAGVNSSILIWLAFIIACGVSIWVPSRLRAVDVLACAIAPAVVLLGTLLAVYLIPTWLGYGLGRAVSTEASALVSPDPIRALSLTLFASVLTVPGVAIAIYARDWVLRTVKMMYGLDPKKLTRVEKSFNSMVRIGAAILAILVVAR